MPLNSSMNFDSSALLSLPYTAENECTSGFFNSLIIVAVIADESNPPLRQTPHGTSDLNRNSIVDSGSLLEHRQPEKVRFFKLKDDFRFEVMESAEIDQTIDLEALFQ
jgi:hypothetical protein